MFVIPAVLIKGDTRLLGDVFDYCLLDGRGVNLARLFVREILQVNLQIVITLVKINDSSFHLNATIPLPWSRDSFGESQYSWKNISYL